MGVVGGSATCPHLHGQWWGIVVSVVWLISLSLFFYRAKEGWSSRVGGGALVKTGEGGSSLEEATTDSSTLNSTSGDTFVEDRSCCLGTDVTILVEAVVVWEWVIGGVMTAVGLPVEIGADVVLVGVVPAGRFCCLTWLISLEAVENLLTRLIFFFSTRVFSSLAVSLGRS